jgi:TolA-binding protein
VFTEEEKSQLEDIKKMAAKAAKKRGKRKFDTPSIKIGPFEIKSSHYEGQELDGEAESKVWLNYHDEVKQKIIAERYKDPESQEYYKNPSPIITPVFLNCLYDSLYPKRFLRRRRNLDKKPLKVLFILDTYEKFDQTVNNWLLEYLLPQLTSERYIDVFDARFIISGREQLSLSDHHQRWDNYRDTIRELDLHRFTKDEVKDYLRQSQVPESLVDEAYEDTDGLAYLLSIWVDTRGKGNALVYGQAANRIYWWKTDEQKEWIRAAAFKEYYDQDFLAIMLGHEKAKEAFEWLKECHEVTRTSEANHNKFQLHATVRRVITKATQQQSESLFQEHTCRARLYEDVHRRFPDVRDRNAMLKLSVFEHFNQAALEKIYPTQGFPLHNFAKEHKEWFDELTHTFKMKPEIKREVYQYSLLQDQSGVSARMDEIVKVWQEKRNETDQRIAQLREKSAKIQDEIKQLDFDVQVINEQIQMHGNPPDIKEVMENTKPEQKQESRWSLKLALIGVTIGVLLALASLLSSGTGRAVLGCTSAILLAGGLTLAIRWRVRPTVTPDFFKVSKGEEERRSHIEGKKRMEEKKRNLESRIDGLNEQLSDVRSEIEKYETVLAESYVVV